MIRRRRRRRDERGATAILVGLMASVLIGMVAFTTDFGIAYANTRSLQTTADAAALGAAGVFAEQTEYECADIRTAGMTEATAEVNDKITANSAGTAPATLTSFTATCEGGDLVVRVTVTATSPNLFGKMLGRSTDYSLERYAASAVEASVTGQGLRPLALCASDVSTEFEPGTPFKLHAPGNGGAPPSSCPIPTNAGNWWTLDCPLESTSDGNGTSGLEDQIRNGCSNPVSIVPNQGSLTGMALNNVLSNSCPSVSTAAPFKCLSGDPGQPDAGQIEDAWEDVIQEAESVPIPVFCSPSPGKCAVSSISGTGTNAVFPIHKLVGVQVCGYHFGKQANRKYNGLTNGVSSCSEASTMLSQMMADNTDNVYLVMVLRNVTVSNVTGDSGCGLGEDCDGGLRQVRLVRGGFAE